MHLLCQHELGNNEQFFKSKIGEVQVVCNARTDTRVGLEEGFHTVLIARENNDEIIALILHHLQEDLDGFLSIVPFVFLTVEVVGLINEEHPSHSSLTAVFGFGGSMADVLTNKVVACHRY